MREEIIKLLDQYRLKEALSQMTGYATHTSDWQLKNELEALQTSYDLMLQYTSKGMKDPNKVEIYHKMLRTAYELADRNFVMYSYPYTDKDTFTKEYFVHKRDSVMKANIPGFKEGVYMSTDSLLTDVRPINVQNSYTMEARGLWRMKGDFMGGPYVSHTRLDEKNQRIITAEIFVYSPDKMKRNLVRQMEASLYTLKLPNEVQQNQIPLGGAAKEAEQTNK